MDLPALFHWIYVIAMPIGALYFMALSRNPKVSATVIPARSAY
jgi:hypothetical protein